jgi:hypothetical protein
MQRGSVIIPDDRLQAIPGSLERHDEKEVHAEHGARDRETEIAGERTHEVVRHEGRERAEKLHEKGREPERKEGFREREIGLERREPDGQRGFLPEEMRRKPDGHDALRQHVRDRDAADAERTTKRKTAVSAVFATKLTTLWKARVPHAFRADRAVSVVDQN